MTERFCRAPDLIDRFSVLRMENLDPEAPLHRRFLRRYRVRLTPSPRASGEVSARAGTAPTWIRPSRPWRSSPSSPAWRHHGCSILRFR